jgi:hypothetical protein
VAAIPAVEAIFIHYFAVVFAKGAAAGDRW